MMVGGSNDFILIITGDNWYVSKWVHGTKIHCAHAVASTALGCRKREHGVAQEWELASI